MSIILILLIHSIYLTTTTIHQCDISSAIDLQSATYHHSLILRVQSIISSEQVEKTMNNIIIRTVLVREVIKIPTIISYNQVKMNDRILIRIDDDLDEIVDDSCWHLLRISNIDIILFLNQTNTDEYNLQYPPVESTFHVRENIDAVLNYGKFIYKISLSLDIFPDV